jgi:hypothetical protein
MITVRHISGRRRRTGGLGWTSILASNQPRAAFQTPSMVLTPELIGHEVGLNTPMMPQPAIIDTIRSVAERQAYASGSPAGANAGEVGGEDTQTAFFVLEAEGDVVPGNIHEFATDEQGRYLDAEGRPLVDSVSPTVAAQGTFLKTWGPPLLAVAGIGIAVWILRS